MLSSLLNSTVHFSQDTSWLLGYRAFLIPCHHLPQKKGDHLGDCFQRYQSYSNRCSVFLLVLISVWNLSAQNQTQNAFSGLSRSQIKSGCVRTVNFVLALLSVSVFCMHLKGLCWHKEDGGKVDAPSLTACFIAYKPIEMHITLGNANTCSIAFFSDWHCTLNGLGCLLGTMWIWASFSEQVREHLCPSWWGHGLSLSSALHNACVILIFSHHLCH